MSHRPHGTSVSPTRLQNVEECLSDIVVALDIVHSVAPVSDENFGTKVFDLNEVLPCKNFSLFFPMR